MAVEHKVETKEDAPVVVSVKACPHPEIAEIEAQGPVPQEVHVTVVVIQVVPVPQPVQFGLIVM